MCDRIHILIVEDEKPMADLMERLVKPLLSHFPGSQVTVAHKLVDALLTVRAYNAPDIVLLDLTLPDSDIENTMNHIDEIDSRCAVVIVTGHSRERVKQMLLNDSIPIVDKSAAITNPGMLARVIVKAFGYWHQQHFDRIQRNLARMRQIVTEAPNADTV